MYFSNSKPNETHLVFIGRWNPFHKGHKRLIEKTMDLNPDLPILVLVRDTSFDVANAEYRASKIMLWVRLRNLKATIIIIPDIQGVYYGRNVGYNVEKINLSKEIEEISGTKIRREQIKEI